MPPKRKVVEICQGSFGETDCKILKGSPKSVTVETAKTESNSRVPMDVNIPEASNSTKHQVSKENEKKAEQAKKAQPALTPTRQAELDKELFSAIKSPRSYEKSNTELIEQLIFNGANVNAKDEKGTPLLHEALDSVPNDTIILLLKSGADPNCTDAEGAGSLLRAMSCDVGMGYHATYKTMKLLIHSGANINQRNKKNETVLWEAVETGEFALVKLLLQHGADATILDNNGNSILNCLARVDWDLTCLRKHDVSEYFAECSRLLQSHGAKLSQADLHEDCATLESYLEYGERKEAIFFVKHWKKGVRGGVKHPLHTAAGNNDPRVLQVLLESELFDVNQRDECDYTPLHIAARSEYEYNLALLLEHGADPDAETGSPAETAYSIARDSRNRPHLQVLLSYGAKNPAGSDAEDFPSDDEWSW